MITPEEILAIKDTKGLQELPSEMIGFRYEMSWPEFDHILSVCDGLWLHSGSFSDPHVELTSGDCSNGFVDVLRALRFSNICQILAYQAVRELARAYSGPVDWVVGSDHAGADFSHSVAIVTGAQHDFTEKGPDKTQKWKRFVIEPNAVVVQAEELMTTSGTLMAVRQGIQESHQYPINFAPSLVLVHRSDVYEIEGKPIIYFVHYDIKVWDPKSCPLCKAGSKRLRPKQNWAELTGQR